MNEKFHKFISAKMPRWFNRLYAFLNNYFWLPCPLCDRYFGGHEWFGENSLWIDYRNAKGVCLKCGERAIKRNKKNNYFIPKKLKTPRYKPNPNPNDFND